MLVFGAGGSQREVETEVKPQRRAVMLVFGAGGGHRKVETLKTSSHARFQDW